MSAIGDSLTWAAPEPGAGDVAQLPGIEIDPLTFHDRLGATELAQALGELVINHEAVSDRDALDLLRLLGHSLAADTPAHRRDARLGLLIEIVSQATGEVPTMLAYEAARAECDSEHCWPTASALAQAYGHWLTAVKAAMAFWFDGGARRVPSSTRHSVTWQPGYQPAEIVRAIARFFFDYRVWPTEWEYTEWRKLQIDAWRRAGLTDRRLPGLKQIRTAYGDYARALGAAQRWNSR